MVDREINYQLKGYTINYDGGLTSTMQIRRSPGVFIPELIDHRVVTTNTKTLTFPSTPNVGDLIVVMHMYSSIFTAPVTLSTPTGYTFRAGNLTDGGNGINAFGIWSKVSNGSETSVFLDYNVGPNRTRRHGVFIIRRGGWKSIFAQEGVNSGSVSTSGFGRLVIVRRTSGSVSNVVGGTSSKQQLYLLNDGLNSSTSILWDRLGTSHTYSVPETLASNVREWFTVSAVGLS